MVTRGSGRGGKRGGKGGRRQESPEREPEEVLVSVNNLEIILKVN